MSGWVPMEQRDTAWWVIQKLYPIRVPSLEMQSPDYIKYFGTPDSGDENTNRQMREELVDVRIPISDMAEYYSQGVQVSIPDPKTTKEIYERIMDHLRAWKHAMDESIHPGTLPAILDDLIKLDNFAAALFPHAKKFFDPTAGQAQFARRLGGLMSISRGGFSVGPLVSEPAETAPDELEVAKHDGFGSAFLDKKNSLSGRRWR